MPREEKDSQSPTNANCESAPRRDFPRRNRLRGRTLIRRVALSGRKYRGKWLGLSVIGSDSARFGISISRKFGKAVRRNRVKRIIREFLRNNKALWPVNKAIMIRLFADPDNENIIIEELRALLARVK